MLSSISFVFRGKDLEFPWPSEFADYLSKE